MKTSIAILLASIAVPVIVPIQSAEARKLPESIRNGTATKDPQRQYPEQVSPNLVPPRAVRSPNLVTPRTTLTPRQIIDAHNKAEHERKLAEMRRQGSPSGRTTSGQPSRRFGAASTSDTYYGAPVSRYKGQYFATVNGKTVQLKRVGRGFNGGYKYIKR